MLGLHLSSRRIGVRVKKSERTKTAIMGRNCKELQEGRESAWRISIMMMMYGAGDYGNDTAGPGPSKQSKKWK